MPLTSDLRREVGGVAGYEALKLLVQVAAFRVHVPGPNSCQRENSRELDQTRLILVQNKHNSLAFVSTEGENELKPQD